MSSKTHLVASILAAGLLAACGGTPQPAAPPATQPPAAPATAPAEAPKSAATALPAAPAAPAKPAESKPEPPAGANDRPPTAPAAEPARPAPESARPTGPLPSGEPKELLSKSYAAMGTVKSFRARMLTTGLAGGAERELKIDVVMPDRFHMTGERTEMILVGSTAWMKLGSQWQKIASGLDIDFADPKKMGDKLGGSTEVKLVGPDLLDGPPTLVYQYTWTAPAPAGAAAGTPARPESYSSKVWIAVADDLPRKLEGEASGMKTTVTYYDYNAPITVTPPA
jgi:hypothetical protein